MGTPARSSPPPQVKSLNCPGCGAPMTIRGFAHTLTVVCPNCLTLLDARDPSFAILQKVQVSQRIEPRIPLGTRGKWRGSTYEAIGFQVRTIMADGVAYSWSEYLLFNPYQGFRYLTEYQGHWNDVVTLRALPAVATSRRPVAAIGGRTFRHFQAATAETTYVLGEFPWQVRAGERVRVMDFVAPPQMLSAEITDDETNWSVGDYVSGNDIWKAFQLPGGPPAAVGIYANQPSPYKGSTAGIWQAFVLMVLTLFLVAALAFTFARDEEVFRQTYSYSPRDKGEASFVTPEFELQGRPSSVEIETDTDLDNNWVYLSYALINADTGQAFDFGREVSYYYGRDSDGAWTEGKRRDSVIVPSVPSGRYYLRVEPEMQAGAPPVRYEIHVRRDVPSMSFVWIAAALLLVPPVIRTFRALAFEQKRWSESDYSSGSGD